MAKPIKPQFVCAVKNRGGGGVLVPGVPGDPIIQHFVWGDSWSYTMPEVAGARFYIEHIGPYPGSYDVPMPPTVTPETVGVYNYPTRNYSGVTAENTTLGPTRVWIDGWSGLESDPDFPDTDVGVSLDVTVNTCFRLYWGDWDGDLPAEFTAEDILGLTHGGVSGPYTRLCTTARNQELQFSALGSAKYRVIAIPYHLAAGGPTGPAGKGMNTIRNGDHTQASLVPAVDTPFGDPQILGINDVYHFIYVIDSTAAAFSVWLRFVEQAAQGYSYGSTTTPWSQSFSIDQIDPETAELISVSVTMDVSWQGALWFENLSTLGTRTLTTDLSTLSVLQIDGTDTLQGTTTSNFAPPTLSAFDGSPDYSGTSSYKYTTRTGSDSDSILLTPGDEGFDGFIGTGTIGLSIESTHSTTVNPISGVTDPETLDLLVFNNKTLVAGYVTFTYFLGGTPTEVTQPEPTGGVLSRVTRPSVVNVETTPAPRSTRITPTAFVPLVKPEGYVPTPRATVASTFKPPLVCAVRNRVTPQPRPPYLPQPVSLEGLNVVANFIDTETGAASVEYLHVVANFVDAITSSASIEKMSVVVVVVDTYP